MNHLPITFLVLMAFNAIGLGVLIRARRARHKEITEQS